MRRAMGFALMVAFLSLGVISGCGSSNDDNDLFGSLGSGGSDGSGGSGGSDGFDGSDGSDGSDGGFGGEETPTPTEAAQIVVDRLNNQFKNGNPEGWDGVGFAELSNAGVLLHQWDGSNCNALYGIPKPGNECRKSWIPFNNDGPRGTGHSVYSIASTIINAQSYATNIADEKIYTGIFTAPDRQPAGGLIFETGPIAQISDLSEPTKVLCMTAADMSSNGRYNSGCGCSRGNNKCEQFFEPAYPSTPLSIEAVSAVSLELRQACISACRNGKPQGRNDSADPNEWVNCPVGTQANPIMDKTVIGQDGCVLAPKISKTTAVPAPDWYVSADELYYSNAKDCGGDGETTNGCSKLKAIMISTAETCAKNVNCYNEIGVNSNSIYTFEASGAQAAGANSPRPTGVKDGAILSFFYLDTKVGSYPASGRGEGANCKKGGQWLVNEPKGGAKDNDNCSYNGQCDTMGRWYIHEKLSKTVLPLIKLDLGVNQGNKNVSIGAFSLICASTMDAQNATEGPCYEAVQACQLEGTSDSYFPYPPDMPSA